MLYTPITVTGANKITFSIALISVIIVTRLPHVLKDNKTSYLICIHVEGIKNTQLSVKNYHLNDIYMLQNNLIFQPISELRV